MANITFGYIFMEECRHCQNFKELFENVKNSMENSGIHFVAINVENRENEIPKLHTTSKVAQTLNRANAFPFIFLIVGDKLHEYNYNDNSNVNGIIAWIEKNSGFTSKNGGGRKRGFRRTQKRNQRQRRRRRQSRCSLCRRSRNRLFGGYNWKKLSRKQSAK